MKHYWYGMEWSGAYYLAYNCRGKDNRPEFVFEWYNKKAKRLKKYEGKPLKILSLLTDPWKCTEKDAKKVFISYSKSLPYTDFVI
jgi:hypothetical protein